MLGFFPSASRCVERNDERAKIKTTPQGAGKGGAFFIAFRRLGGEDSRRALNQNAGMELSERVSGLTRGSIKYERRFNWLSGG